MCIRDSVDDAHGPDGAVRAGGADLARDQPPEAGEGADHDVPEADQAEPDRADRPRPVAHDAGGDPEVAVARGLRVLDEGDLDGLLGGRAGDPGRPVREGDRLAHVGAEEGGRLVPGGPALTVGADQRVAGDEAGTDSYTH